MKIQEFPPVSLLATGIDGLPPILGGRSTPKRVCLAISQPFTGKITTGLQFLMESARHGQSAVRITRAGSNDELREAVEPQGWPLKGFPLRGARLSENLLRPDVQHMAHATEAEMGATLRNILLVTEKRKPTRVVINSLTEQRRVAVHNAEDADLQTRSVAHGVIALDQTEKSFCSERRRVRMVRCKSRALWGGRHDHDIHHCGLRLIARCVAAQLWLSRVRCFSRVITQQDQRQSGIDALDNLLDGRLKEGNSTLIAGLPTTGKSNLSAQFVQDASWRGQPSAVFLHEVATSSLHSWTGCQFSLLSRGMKVGAVRRCFCRILTGGLVRAGEAASTTPGTADDEQPVQVACIVAGSY